MTSVCVEAFNDVPFSSSLFSSLYRFLPFSSRIFSSGMKERIKGCELKSSETFSHHQHHLLLFPSQYLVDSEKRVKEDQVQNCSFCNSRNTTFCHRNISSSRFNDPILGNAFSLSLSLLPFIPSLPHHLTIPCFISYPRYFEQGLKPVSISLEDYVHYLLLLLILLPLTQRLLIPRTFPMNNPMEYSEPMVHSKKIFIYFNSDFLRSLSPLSNHC